MDMTMTNPASLDGWNEDNGADTSAIRLGDLTLALSAHGDLAAVHLGDLQISQYPVGPHDAPVSGLWLRHRGDHGIDVVPLTGVRVHAHRSVIGNGVTWIGEDIGVNWEVRLEVSESPLADASWAWTVEIRPKDKDAGDIHEGTWDIVSAQDLALAPSGQALTSEPYISQYVAFHAYHSPDMGVVLAARQTMACAPRLPLYLTAIREGCAGYATDGFDFYGKNARLGEEPRALRDADWSMNRIDQYEFAMACMQSRPRRLGERLTWHVTSAVFRDYRKDLDEACGRYDHMLLDTINGTDTHADPTAAHAAAVIGTGGMGEEDVDSVSLLASAPILNGDDVEDQTLRGFAAGEPLLPEYDDAGRLMSFFSTRARHVVARAKELRVDRSHGQILLSGCNADPTRPVFATTTYAPGVFASHVVLGNTNMNRLVSVQHTSLNLMRSQGVRILVKARDGEAVGFGHGWLMLGVPSVFVMEIGGSQWVYHIGDSTIIVSTTASSSDDRIDIHLRSTVAIDAMVTVDIEQAHHWDIAGRFDGNLSGIVLAPAPGTPTAQTYPGLSYALVSDDAGIESDAALFGTHKHGHGSGVVLFRSVNTRTVHMTLAAGMQGGDRLRDQMRSFFATSAAPRYEDLRERILQDHYDAVNSYTRRLHVHGNGRLSEFNVVIPWFMQNAMVHFLSPHGLEQYSGAAWGTRDVCQGPFESALAFGHYDIARTILITVFKHQNVDGSLPQWFMFDAYAAMYQRDAHGDIPVWPLIAMGEYLDATADRTILDTPVGFWDMSSDSVVESQSTVRDHLERTLSYIRTHRVPGTELFSYGEGDWDDTLQPAKESMKKDMASTWTIALLYQASHALETQLRIVDPARSRDLAEAFGKEASTIHASFARDFVFDGVLAGYVSFPQGVPTPMIHPSDRRTGIAYRLIPMTRSIIAGLLDEPAMRRHEAIIERHLHYPDGVRLMSSPASFHDGVITVFKRAEQAANIGREIGLMYTHAHIRYVEALAALGREHVGDELLRISPVGQFSRLATSELRQRNCYFASSDADFPDRYTAAREWDRLRADSNNPVGVRGGWRVYSSGPGIYLRQLMQHLFGIQLHADHVVFDPLLERGDDGTTVDVVLFGELRHIRYHVVDGPTPVTVTADGELITGHTIALPYRRGGLSIAKEKIADAQNLDVTVGLYRQ